jgi:hypothetical protein
VVKRALDAGIEFRHASKMVEDPRAEEMADLYRLGYTLQQIGEHFGISRERVRQIMTARKGIRAKDGGQTVQAKRTRERKSAEKDAKAYARYGCSYSQLSELRRLTKEATSGGGSYYRTPIGAFCQQRNNAKLRGIDWSLSLWQWWTIWQDSGLWDKRGRGRDAYVMCRYGDTGGYTLGNVYISTAIHNIKFQPNNPYRLSHPDHEAFMAQLRSEASKAAA